VAIVGEARIIVRADTSKVKSDIEKGFTGLENTVGKSAENLSSTFIDKWNKGFSKNSSANVFTKLSDAIGEMAPAAEKTATRIQSMIQSGYLMSQKMAVAGNSIAAVVGGITALGSAFAAAAPAMVVFGNGIAAIKLGTLALKFAMGGVDSAIQTVWKSQTALNDTFRAAQQEYIDVKFAATDAALAQQGAALALKTARENLLRTSDLPSTNIVRQQAMLQYEQASQAAVEAQHKTSEAVRAVKKGIGATNAYQPLAGLTKAQLAFTKFIVALRPQILQFQSLVSSAFLPSLEKSVGTLMTKAFPTVQKGFVDLAKSAGEAVSAFTKVFTSGNNMKLFSSLLTNSAKIFAKLGTVAGNIFSVILNVLNAAAPLANRFVGWVVKLTNTWKTTFETRNKSGELTKFFNAAGDMAAKLGAMLKPLGQAFANIFNPVNGTGKAGALIMVDYLTKAFQHFADVTKSKWFESFLTGSAKGLSSMLSALGSIGGAIFKAFNPKNTQIFWNTIGKIAPDITKILEGAGAALPDFAKIIKNIFDVLATFAGDGAIKAFFGTIKAFSDVIVAIVKNPIVAWILRATSAFHGLVLGILVVTKVSKTFGLYILGTFKKIFAFLGGKINFFDRMKNGFKKLGEEKDTRTLEQKVKDLAKEMKATQSAMEKLEKAAKNLMATIKTLTTAFNNLYTAVNRLATPLKNAKTAMNGLKTETYNASKKVDGLKTATQKAGGEMRTATTKTDNLKSSLRRLKTEAKDAEKALKNVKSPGMGGGGLGSFFSRGGGKGGGGGGILGNLGSGIFRGIGSSAAEGALAGDAAGAVGGAAAAEGASAAGGPIAMAVVGAGLAASAAISPMVQLYQAQKQTDAQTKLLINENGIYGKKAKDLAGHLKKVAIAQGNVSGTTESVAASTQQMLLHFEPLTRTLGKSTDQFDKATKLSIDMSKALGTDAPTAAQMLGQALASPTTAIDDLTGAGVIFSKKEKDKYDAVLKSNGVFEAQKTLIDDLNTKYGGFASKTATTSDKLAAKWEQIGKKWGKIFTPMFNSFADILNNLADAISKVSDIVNGNVTKTQTAVTKAVASGGTAGYAGGVTDMGAVQDLGNSLVSSAFSSVYGNGKKGSNANPWAAAFDPKKDYSALAKGTFYGSDGKLHKLTSATTKAAFGSLGADFRFNPAAASTLGYALTPEMLAGSGLTNSMLAGTGYHLQTDKKTGMTGVVKGELSKTAAASPQIQITVNPSAGMSETELAKSVSREVAKVLGRSGTH
jgi:hypothetical protein